MGRERFKAGFSILVVIPLNKQENDFYIRLKRFSVLFDEWAYFDVPDYYADNLFIKHKCPVVFGTEFRHKKSPYRVITCKTLKILRHRFTAAMHELPYMMALNGRGDYLDYCAAELQNIRESAKKQ